MTSFEYGYGFQNDWCLVFICIFMKYTIFYVVTDDVLLYYQRECLQSTFSVFSHSSSNKYCEDSFLWGILNKKEGEFIRDMKGQLTL